MATFHFDLVSPEKLAFSGEVDQVDVPGIEGDFGVLAGHAPVVAAIRPGILTVTAGGNQQKIVVLGGIAEVSEKGLTVLADVATSMADLDAAQFAADRRAMEAAARRQAGLRTRPRHRAARSLQEHPAPAHHHRDALSGAAHAKFDFFMAGLARPFAFRSVLLACCVRRDGGLLPRPALAGRGLG